MSVDSRLNCLSNIRFLISSLQKKNFKVHSEQLFELVEIFGLEADRYLLRCLLSNIDFTESITKITSPPSVHVQLFQNICDVLINKPSFISLICYSFEYLLTVQSTLKHDSNFFHQISKILKLTTVQEVAITSALRFSLNSDLELLAKTHLKTIVPILVETYIDSSGRTDQHEGGLHETTPETLHFILADLLSTPKEFGLSSELYVSFTRTLQKDFSRDFVPVVITPFIYQIDLEFERVMSSSTSTSTNNSSNITNLGAIVNDSDKNTTDDSINNSINNHNTNMNNNSINITDNNSITGGKPSESLINVIFDFGYDLTSCADKFRCNFSVLSNLNGADNIKEEFVAAVLMAMFRYDESDLRDDENDKFWDFDIFIDSIKEFNNSLRWKVVICELDSTDFQVIEYKSLKSFITFVTILHISNQISFKMLFRFWINFDNQFRLMQAILKYPELVPLSILNDSLINVDGVVTQVNLNSPENMLWRISNFVKCLLTISERAFFNEIKEIFKQPLQTIPEVLILVLIPLYSTGGNILVRDLMLSLIAYFASSNNCNTSLIFHAIWSYSCGDLKMSFLRCLSELYIKNQFDTPILSKILDIAHELKAFNAFLATRLPLPFIIDFACLASRREYLNLEIFLNEKIRDYGDQFIKALVECLSRRSPVAQKIDDNSILSKSSPLPQETVNVILNCIQSSLTTNVSEVEDSLKYRSPLMMLPSNSNTSNVTNAVNIAAMIRNQRMHLQQPPQQSIDTVSFSQSLTANHLFKTASVTTAAAAAAAAAAAGLDPINTLSNLTLNKFNMSTAPLGQLMSSSPTSSPSRIMPGTSVSNTNTFQSIMSLQQQQQQQQQHQVTAAIGTSTQPLVPNLSSVSNFNRMSNNNLVLEKMSMNPTAVDSRPLYPDTNIEFSKEAEEEANTYFQRIYNHATRPSMTVDEILDVLKRFRDSKVDHEVEILNCMVKNLFDEFQFFPQYPEEELHITAQLFGGLIERNILPDYISTGLALRFVLEALKKPPNTKMYFFGLTALERFKPRLKDFIQYCENIRIIPHYNEFPSHLIEYIESGLQGIDPPSTHQRITNPVQNLLPIFKTNASNPVSATTSSHSTPSKTIAAIAATPRPSIANATNIDTLLIATDKSDKIKEPPEPIQEKVAFIFNNLSQLNIQSKCEEIKEILIEEYWPWFAQYLVMKRVTIELNFHTLYVNFMDAIRIPEINKFVIEETFRNIKVLLRSDKIMSNFSDRSLLKNLGHWLGMLTLARNKPILFTDIDFRSLLLEAYHLGQEELLFIVPFIAKVLESAVRSKVFKPPNPWTMAILNMLGELHAEPKTKLNLKFEVEVLCKALKVDLKSLEPTNVLNDPEVLKSITYQLHQPNKKNVVPIYNDDSGLTNLSSLIPTTIQQHQPQPQQQQPLPQSSQSQQRESPTPISPVPPRFSYFDNTISMSNIFNSVMINSSLILIQSNPTLKDLVRKAFEQAAQECLASVCDRLTKIVVCTTEQTVCRDFALDPDENHLRIAAHHMVRHLASGYVMISCREQIVIMAQRNLKDVLVNALNLQTDDKDLKIIEATVNTLIQDNIDLMSAVVQKTSIERAIHDIDKRLVNEYKERIKAKNEGRSFQHNQFIFNYHRDRMPEMLRMKPGTVTQQQLTVYNEFARNIPGFTPITTDREMSLLLPKTPPLIGLLDFNNPSNVNISNNLHPVNMVTNNGNNMLNNSLQVTEEFLNVIEKLAMECEQFLQLYANLSTTNSTYIILINRLKESLFKAKTLQGNYLSIDLITTTVESLQKGMQLVPSDIEIVSVRFRDLHIRILKALQDSRGFGTQWVNKIVTRTLVESNSDELRFCVQAIEILIRAQLVHAPTYDLHLSQCMENGNNLTAVNFCIQLLKVLLVDNRANNLSESDFFNVLEILNRLLTNGRLPIPDGLSNLIETIYNGRENSTISYEKSTSSVAHIHSGIVQMRSGELNEVPCDMFEKTEMLMQEWIAMYHNNLPSRDSSRVFQHFIQQMSMAGVLKTDDLITTFFSIATRLCIEVVYRALQDPNISELDLRGRSFHAIDPFVRLIVLLVKHSGDNSNSNTKLNLFNKIVGLITGAVLQDHDVRGTDFHQLSYHRILILLFIEMNSNEPVLETINFQVINTYCHVLHILRPTIVSGFTYAWLEIISHRMFIGRLLYITPQQKGWAFYAQLLIDLFKFLAPFLRSAQKSKAILSVYNGTLKLLLVLLHDFPEFLVDYQYGFCDVIPPNCIQLRNLILSAFPRNMRLADPFVVNLRVDQLPEMTVPPRILTNYVSNIKSEKLKHDIDLYLQKRTPVTFLSELRTYLQTDCEPGNRYNIPLMNALVLYVGVQAIACIRSRNLQISAQTIACSAHMDIYQNLLVDLDNEGRYIFLNAIANHLRFPNSHTHYFSCVILKLFAEANSPKVQEQITRILLERLVVNRPHPWGLLITFIDLIKNPTYKFWSHDFVSCAPEITNLLESVARSCQVQKQTTQNSDTMQ